MVLVVFPHSHKNTGSKLDFLHPPLRRQHTHGIVTTRGFRFNFLALLSTGLSFSFSSRVPWQVCSLKQSSQPAVGLITVAPRPFPGFPGQGDGPARLAPCRGLSGQLTIGAKWLSIFYHAEGRGSSDALHSYPHFLCQAPVQ